MIFTSMSSAVSVRGFTAITSWQLLLLIIVLFECMPSCDCAVITRRDANVDSKSQDEVSNDEVLETVTKAPDMKSQYMNCYPAKDCFEDCTERLNGKMHIERDCKPVGAVNGFFPTFFCECHFGNVDHEEDYEGSNELPIFPSRFYKPSSSPRSKRNMKFLVSN